VKPLPVNLCRHWQKGLITHLHDVCPFCEIDRLKGERTVLINLLMAAKNVIETVDGESTEECENLMDLNNKMHYAINGAIQGLV
jgi:hypothetical protein